MFASADKFSKSVGQLVHDLQSPIAALRAATRGANFQGPEELALVGASFSRLDGIISETLENGRIIAVRSFPGHNRPGLSEAS